jgi:NAD(P)-dependent dehydrogenase (short-subunit alcohol dehydrogenase family)
MPTALITGGTGGLGVAVVRAFLDDGWRVVAPLLRGGGAERLPAEAEGVDADLTDPDDVARAMRIAASDDQRPLKAVANLVGGFAAGQPVATTPLADFEAQFALNLRPTYLVTQCALPRLEAAGGGAIVCIASHAAVEPFAGAAGYVASKAAVTAFARTVALEHEGVRCNVVSPSMIDTPANRAAMPGAVGKMVPPERIAAVVKFLCGDASAAVNGAVLEV